MPRVQNHTAAFNDRPFSGSGASLYATVGDAVVYRGLRVLQSSRMRRRNGWIKGTGGRHDIAASSVLKTTRRDSVASPDAEFAYTLPAAFASQTVQFDVRQYADDIENTTDNFAVATITFDAGLEDDTGIVGTATLLTTEPRAGGIVRIRLIYNENSEGVQPTVFRASRTAGPTSPAATTASYAPGQRFVEIDTAALSDSAAYTFKVTAENAGGTVTADVLTGITITADATGPAAPTSVSVEAV